MKKSKFEPLYQKADKAFKKIAVIRRLVTDLKRARTGNQVRLNIPRLGNLEMRKLWTLFDDLNHATDILHRANRSVERALDLNRMRS